MFQESSEKKKRMSMCVSWSVHVFLESKAKLKFIQSNTPRFIVASTVILFTWLMGSQQYEFHTGKIRPFQWPWLQELFWHDQRVNLHSKSHEKPPFSYGFPIIFHFPIVFLWLHFSRPYGHIPAFCAKTKWPAVSSSLPATGATTGIPQLMGMIIIYDNH